MRRAVDRHRSAPVSGAGIEVYLSHPFPHRERQRAFIVRLQQELIRRGLAPRTVAELSGTQISPLAAIRSRMLESHGLIVVAFRRLFVVRGIVRDDSEDPALPAAEISGSWLTSSYCQIEPAMAYQLFLPLMVLREHGVVPEGFLDGGAEVLNGPEFDLQSYDRGYFGSGPWVRALDRWEALVRLRFSGESGLRRAKGAAAQ